MTKVVLFPSAYLPALGGVEELTRHLALANTASGHEVEVWTGTARDTDPPRTERLDEVTVRRVPLPLPAGNVGALWRFPAGALRSMRWLRNAVAEFSPDVLHVQCFGPNGVYATALSKVSGVPLVVTLQGETVMDDGDVFDVSAVLRLGLRAGLRQARVVTGCSAFTLADAEARFGLRPGRGVVVPNGVPLDGESQGDCRWEGAPNRPYVLAVGRVVVKKGFDLLLDAYGAIEPSRRRFDLVIGGEGPELPALRKRAGAMGLSERVHFPGRLTRDEVAAAMTGADLFVVPSRLEPFGIVVLEAWRAGTAVVATSIGGPPELIDDGADGVLVDPFDKTSFAATLVRLMGDPGGCELLGLAGRERVRAFEWTAIAARYRRLYDQVAPPG